MGAEFWGLRRRLPGRLPGDVCANAAIEFALVAPVFLVFLMGIISYGGYFWLAHNLQELANDSARAAVGGLTADERSAFARSSFDSQVASYGALTPARANVVYNGTAQNFTVSVSYDASRSGFWAISGLIPMPSSTIVRTASIRLGGY
ncbi:MAG TPA: TadE/TadG family type IV pilus assembly protein [Rhizomicrobium sp.]|nr:TadE/TadG family type IV pilus assembly protein [Rhizomicrobium sp.]